MSKRFICTAERTRMVVNMDANPTYSAPVSPGLEVEEGDWRLKVAPDAFEPIGEDDKPVRRRGRPRKTEPEPEVEGEV